jgi:hypothetical protein
MAQQRQHVVEFLGHEVLGVHTELVRVAILGAVLVAGCTAPGGVAPASGPASTASQPQAVSEGMPDVPVDSTLQAVSKSAPSGDAAKAMELCLREGELDQVTGMAQLPARDVHRFMLTNGKEPELQKESLAWAIQLKGHFWTRRGYEIIDPLCVVVDGTPLRYAPYGHVGEKFVPPSDFLPPEAALPPLAP